MHCKLLKILVIYSLCSSFQSLSSQTWIPIADDNNGKTISTEIIKSDAYCYWLKVRINRLYEHIVKNDMGEFYNLSFDDPFHLMEVGSPALPLFLQTIAIPEGAVLSLSISEQNWKDINIGKIYPAQTPCNDNSTDFNFTYNKKVYEMPFTPSLIIQGKEMRWRNIRNTTIAVCPFKYDAQQNKLSVLKEFVLQVEFKYSENSNKKRGFTTVNNDYGLFDNIIIDSIDIVPRSSAEADKYLIIVREDLGADESEALKKFRIWKAVKGYNTEVMTISSTQNTPTHIKSLITQKYNQYNGHLKYVMLIGDASNITQESVCSHEDSPHLIFGDYWYGCLDGGDDAEADLPIGRFSCSNLNELKNMVDKTIKYERHHNLLEQTLLVAHCQYAPHEYQACCDSIYNTTYSENMTFIQAYGSSTDYHGKNAFIIDNINQGTNIINYRGHASTSYWGAYDGTHTAPMWNVSGEVFASSEIDSISDGTNTLFFSIACQSGHLGADSCMLEVFTRSPKGASVFIGAVDDTDTETNHIYNRFIYKKLLNNGINNIGDLNNAAHIASYLPGYDRSLDNRFSYICGGDPSLEIWTSAPNLFGIVDLFSRNDSILISTTYMGVCSVSISSINGDYLGSHLMSAGECRFLKPADKFYFSIHKKGFLPYFACYDSTANFIQNKIFDGVDYYYDSTPIFIGEDVDIDGDDDFGPVIVKEDTKLNIKNGPGGVYIKNSFECENGANFIIK